MVSVTPSKNHRAPWPVAAILLAMTAITPAFAQEAPEFFDEPPESAEMMPGAQPQPGAPAPSPEEIAELKAQFEALDADEQSQMRAYYADMGVNLDDLLGLSLAQSTLSARAQQVAMAMREMNFMRTPQAVLSARTELGFGRVPQPNPETAMPHDMARWIHLHVMAGDWSTLSQYFRSRPEAEAEPVYAIILQSMNRGDPGLLPEEVLSFAEASPTEPTGWKMTALGAMLGASAKKNSPLDMLAQLKEGGRWFGPHDDASRRRTVDLLAGAGLVLDAYDYLPALDVARAGGDAALILVHARYKHDLASRAIEGPSADALRANAWDLFTEAAMSPRAPAEVRREALGFAIGMMTTVPHAKVDPWLRQVFESDSLGPVALEIMALNAASIGNSTLSMEERAEAVVALKEGVDILLTREDLDSTVLRVPLRMLTTALIGEMEAVTDRQGVQQRMIARDAQVLVRAIPSPVWLRSIEPSLAARASAASIAVALLADETDLAISLLNDAIARRPEQAAELTDHFLIQWTRQLTPFTPEYDDEMYWYYQQFTPMAPLTRGRQRRNLDRLDGLLAALSENGVDPRTLPSVVPVFQACHARTEVYERDDIVRVFGPIDAIPASTAAYLAQAMSASLNSDWRNRTLQRQSGTKRSDSEIALLVDKGYGLAIELIEGAIASDPDSWRYDVLRAAMTYDRMQFLNSQGKINDPLKRVEYQRAAFDAFADAAERYSQALAQGLEREDIGVFRRWFGAAMGAAELTFLRTQDLPTEGSLQHDEIDRIAASMHALPEDSRDRHLAEFAREVVDAVAGAAPEVKPRIVTHAMRIVGDHPAGASLRAMDDLYRDLLRDEIRLRVALDGDGRVGVDAPFGALISVRFTFSVDRETGGFAKYLQNGMWGRRGNTYARIDYRDELEKAIKSALAPRFTIEAIAFFEPFMPPRGVVEDGEDGWLEKPFAYVVLSREDPSVDRLPQIVLDMQFNDQTGPVTLALPSNTPLLATSEDRSARPIRDLSVVQVVDLRELDAPDGEDEVTLEVRMRGRGVVPDVREALDGLDTALDGYRIDPDGVEAQPPIVLQEGQLSTGNFGWYGPQEPKDGYPEPDDDGMYRLTIERSFIVRYVPDEGERGNSFNLPVLREGVAGTLESRAYSDFDIVPVLASSVAITPNAATARTALLLLAIACVAVAAAAAILFRQRRARAKRPDVNPTPARLTPIGVVTSLRRIEREPGSSLDDSKRAALREEILAIELKYFGPDAQDYTAAELAPIINRWSGEPSSRNDA